MHFERVKIKGLVLFFLFLAFPTEFRSYHEFSCEDESIFFLNDLKLKEIEVSSFYCDFGKPQYLTLLGNNGAKINTFIKYDKITKTISTLSKKELKDYIRRLKKDLEIVKASSNLKDKISEEYANNYVYYKGKLPQFFKKYIFSREELLKISKEIENSPYRVFEKTYSTRLLMNGKIISREQWGADETYSKKEVYMKGCEDGSCYTEFVRENELRENYLKYFYKIDKLNKKVKTFDDGRDPLEYLPVDRIIIHHTAGPYIATKEEGISYMKSIHRYHALSLRWGDIGYHYLIDGEGNIYEGKAGGKYVVGNHTAVHNYGSIGIALMSDSYYSPKMLESLRNLIIYLGEEYNLDLTKKTTVRSNDLVGWTQGWVVVAHKELDPKKPRDPEIDMDKFRMQIILKIKSQKKLSSNQNTYDNIPGK